jgi:hypothetical protein
MLRSLEIVTDGNLHPEVLTYLAGDTGLFVPQDRSVAVSCLSARSMRGSCGPACLAPGVRHTLARFGTQSPRLTA